MIDRFKKNRALFTIIGVVLFGLLLCGTIILLVPSTGSGVGNIAPDFVMQLSDDNSRALSSFRGNTVVLVFWDRDFWDDQFFYVNGVARKLYFPDKLNQLYQKSAGKDPAIKITGTMYEDGGKTAVGAQNDAFCSESSGGM